jgi:hypothetical protein
MPGCASQEPSDGLPVPGAEQRSFGSPKRPGGRDEADIEGGGEPEWQGSPQRPAQPDWQGSPQKSVGEETLHSGLMAP